MFHLVQAGLAESGPALREVALRADRISLAKRLWRGTADDGTEFGFELAAPLKHGQSFFQSSIARYVIQQTPEAVVEIPLDLPPSAAAGIGWSIGNLHLELAAEPGRMLAADEPALRQLLDRLQVPYTRTQAIFRPGRFARRDTVVQDVGPGHQHA